MVLISKRLIPLHPRMVCAKFGWNLTSGSGEEIFLKKILLNFDNVFWLFRNYLPLEMGVALHLKKVEFSITQWCFVPSLVEIGPVNLEKKMKMWKVYRQTDGRTNDRTDGRQAIKNFHLSFQLRWTNKKAIELEYLFWVFENAKHILGANKQFLRVTCKVVIYRY